MKMDKVAGSGYDEFYTPEYAVKPIMKVDEVKGECINLTSAKKYFSRFENYELIETFTYRDSMPMMVLILKRIK